MLWRIGVVWEDGEINKFICKNEEEHSKAMKFIGRTQKIKKIAQFYHKYRGEKLYDRYGKKL